MPGNLTLDSLEKLIRGGHRHGPDRVPRRAGIGKRVSGSFLLDRGARDGMHAYAYLLTVDVDITPREKTALVLCDLEDDNLKGPFLVMKHGIPHLIRSGGGSIINVVSV